jgi:DNA mismatch endonuclease (patch repair protein)
MRGLSKAQISDRMRLIRSKHTKPELLVRAIASKLGLKAQPHGKKLPGTPDLVFSAGRKVVFVHGCFWHQHANCRLRSVPRANRAYWIPKFAQIRARDRRNKLALTKLRWKYLVVWECETKDVAKVRRRLVRFLRQGRRA